MKKNKLLIVSIIVIMCSCENNTYKNPETEIEEVSYSLGVNMASSIKQQGLDNLDAQAVAKGVDDFFKENDLDISEEESITILQEFFKRIQSEKNAEANEAGKKFLSENGARTEVTTTESGLQYEVLESGEGDIKPIATDNVTVHYHGTLIDGTVFDSSVDRGEPTSFPVNGVIPGWVEALQLMSIGDKWKLTIPSNLAYGDRGAPGSPIGPGATLIFEVELLKIN